MTADKMTFEYTIEFKSGRKQALTVELDTGTLALVSRTATHPPDWARIECSRCANCALDPARHPYCPVASNLAVAAEAFQRNLSFEEVSVTIRTQARTYQRSIALQDALRSLFGVYMVASGCPVLDMLRPLVRMHLPFATLQETAYRALSMYVLAQFFIQRKGGAPDYSLEGLGGIYREIETVNRALHGRLVKAGYSDAVLNAIGNLNCYAQFTQMFLEPGKLEEIEKLFAAYLPPSNS